MCDNLTWSHTSARKLPDQLTQLTSCWSWDLKKENTWAKLVRKKYAPGFITCFKKIFHPPQQGTEVGEKPLSPSGFNQGSLRNSSTATPSAPARGITEKANISPELDHLNPESVSSASSKANAGVVLSLFSLQNPFTFQINSTFPSVFYWDGEKVRIIHPITK